MHIQGMSMRGKAAEYWPAYTTCSMLANYNFCSYSFTELAAQGPLVYCFGFEKVITTCKLVGLLLQKGCQISLFSSEQSGPALLFEEEGFLF